MVKRSIFNARMELEFRIRSDCSSLPVINRLGAGKGIMCRLLEGSAKAFA